MSEVYLNGGGEFAPPGTSGSPPPDYQSGDWALIGDLAGDATGYSTATASSLAGTTALNLNGAYNASDVTATTITFADPSSVNSDWTLLTGQTPFSSPSLATQGEGWVGPFVLDEIETDTAVVNVIAPQGMYLVTKKGKDKPRQVDVIFELTPVDETGDATGAPFTATLTVRGNGTEKAARGDTLEIPLPTAGRHKIRARRLTPKELDTEDTIVDEVKWRDCFATAQIAADDFGDITTVFSRTYATAQATAQKERKLTCKATRKILVRNGGDTFGPALEPSLDAAQIICHMALDSRIGGRELYELDVPQLYATGDEIEAYFGIVEARQFSHTFDESNISFEEMVQTVAQGVFCNAYRQGSELRLFFERKTDDATLLFNHRNKIPGSETRTVTFGYHNDNDGVELEYVREVDGLKETIYRPADRSAVKPKKIEITGPRSEKVANLHADRIWNKIRYQHTATTFGALGEASQLIRGEKILVTDGTRPDVFDGHVEAQDGLVLTLTQPFAPVSADPHTIFIQRPAGGVEAIALAGVVPGVPTQRVTLAQAPLEIIDTSPERWADTAYEITSDADPRESAFVLTEKGAYDRRSLELEAINYDARYYAGDQAYNGAQQ